MDNNRGNIGRNALEIFKALWNGTGDASEEYLDSEFIPAENSDALIPAEWIIVIT